MPQLTFQFLILMYSPNNIWAALGGLVLCNLLSILKEACPEKRAHWQAPARLVKAPMRSGDVRHLRRARALGRQGMAWRESIRLLSAIFSPSSIALCFRGRQGTVQVCQVPFRIIRRLRSVWLPRRLAHCRLCILRRWPALVGPGELPLGPGFLMP